ncbi:substrate-binding protein [Desertimonas flava]|uniref:substrate-binding protein n=1 Tax=Desertimonas flava TaxID=2064846 RepID=UPI003B8341B9
MLGSRLGGVAGAQTRPVPYNPDPVTGPEAVYGFNVPLTGSYADEGADELKAYELAVQHLNEGGGMLETLEPSALTGQGVLGKKITYVQGDTQTDADAARASARRMIERDGAIMFSGGSSSAVAIAQQYLAQEMGVIFMNCLTHSNDTTGKDRQRYGFRHFFNAYMSGVALGPILAEEYGDDRRAFHLTADYTWGHTQLESMQASTEAQGWSTVQNIMTPLGTTDYSQYLTPVINSDADVLVLNHYGQDMVNSLTQAVEFGMRDREVDGRPFEVVVPLYSRLMAQGAGDAIEGIFGTTNWSYKLENPGTEAFVTAFEEAYDQPPSQAAHTAYVQTILYSDAAERAGTFYAPEVIKALEDHTVDGIGHNGSTLYRGCDHQAFHEILVVRGKAPSERDSEFDLLETVKEIPAADVEYECDYFEGDLGPYEPA